MHAAIERLKAFREFFTNDIVKSGFNYSSTKQYRDTSSTECGTVFCIGGWATIWAQYIYGGLLSGAWLDIFFNEEKMTEDIQIATSSLIYAAPLFEAGMEDWREESCTVITHEMALERLDKYIEYITKILN